jgi:hypothetical protein
MKIDLMKQEVLAACNRKIDRLVKVANLTDRPINIRNVRLAIHRLQHIRADWVDTNRLNRSLARIERLESANCESVNG